MKGILMVKSLFKRKTEKTKMRKLNIYIEPGTEKIVVDVPKHYIKIDASQILAYLMNRSNELNALMKQAQLEEKELLTTDFAFYEAISSARGNVEVPLDRMKILLWNITIIPDPVKKEITRERMNEIRRAYGGI